MKYDLIIIGAGPAGLTAALYGSRAMLKTLIIEKGVEGGQITNTVDLENYPGITAITGMDLGQIIRKQAKSFGAEIISDEVIEVDLESKIKSVKTKNAEYESKTIIIASGTKFRPLGFAGESEFAGRGISYCAVCDAAFYQNLDVYVVGGGDSALKEALFIEKFARKVYIIHRRDSLRASKILVDKANASGKIEFIYDTVVEEVKGDKLVEELILKNVKTEEITIIKKDKEPFGIFIFAGFEPEISLFKDVIELENGYIKTDEEMRTNIDGVFAAGDIRSKSLRQVVTATADGAIAATNAEKYIESYMKDIV